MRLRTSTTGRRLVAVLAAGSFGVLLPAAPGFAQQAPGYAEPPPVNPAAAPAPAKPSAPGNLEKSTECVKPGTLDGGVVYPEAPWGQQYLRVEDAHQFATGNGVRVAVIDTGVSNHNFLTKPVVGGGDSVVTGENGQTDCDGHGTEVAGIIAGNPPKNRNIGFRGMAPNAEIFSIRQTSSNYSEKGSDGKKTAGDTASLAQAVMWAAAQGSKVINISVDSCRTAGPINADEQALQAAIRQATDQYNAVVVAAAGNIGGKCQQNDQADPDKPKFIVTPPWFSEDVLSVAAIQQDGSVAPFSMRGPWVSVAAPGTDIVSLDPANPSQLANRQAEKGQEPKPIQGTSFAAPYVSGTVALVREKFPNLSARQVMNRIKMTAQHPGAPNGRDQFVGYGVVNPVAALTATVPGENNTPVQQVRPMRAELPEPAGENTMQLVVALSAAGGALAALGITLFVVHTVRRHRGETGEPRGYA